jgi:hypothetical protein
MDHATRLRPDHQYLVGARSDALAMSPAELTEAWLGLVDRAHQDLPAGGQR